MESVTYLLPALGCTAMMGGMVWMMTRDRGEAPLTPEPSRQQELARLRDELAELRRDHPGVATKDAELR